MSMRPPQLDRHPLWVGLVLAEEPKTPNTNPRNWRSTISRITLAKPTPPSHLKYRFNTSKTSQDLLQLYHVILPAKPTWLSHLKYRLIASETSKNFLPSQDLIELY